MTLIDLGETGYRKNGGIGFAISGIDVKLRFCRSAINNIAALAKIGFSALEIDRLYSRIVQIQLAKSLHPIHLVECEAATLHSGFGVGTAINLAIVEALFLLSDRETSSTEIARLSGRGGTSGIGVNTYFEGGFVFDIGRQRDSSKFASSDDHVVGYELPRIFSRVAMPPWKIGVLIPPGSTSLESERKLFSKILPIPASNVYEISYHSVFGAAAAAVDADYNSFCLATNAIQETTWKKAEIEIHGEDQRRAMTALREIGCQGVGMSSMGPAIYFMAKELSKVIETIKHKFNGHQVLFADFQNHGRTLSYV